MFCEDCIVVCYAGTELGKYILGLGNGYVLKERSGWH